MKTRYLQLSSGHLENELHHGADSEASRAGRVDLVPNGVTVHLDDTHNKKNQRLSRLNSGETVEDSRRRGSQEKSQMKR